MMNVLARQDLDVLVEAVEAWESSELSGEIMSTVFMSITCRPNDPVAKAKLEEELAKNRSEYDRKRKAKKERGVMLRAKLIQLRDSVDADAFVQESLK